MFNRDGQMWNNFVKEGLFVKPKSYNNKITSEKLTGQEAKFVYESIINLNESRNECKIQPTVKPAEKTETENIACKAKVTPKTNSFLRAAQNNDITDLNNMLKCCPGIINCTDIYGWTALMCASQAGSLDAVECLLRNGADVKKLDKNGRNAYSIAKCAKHKQVTKLLKLGRSNVRAIPKDYVKKSGFCDICHETSDDMDSHLLSIEHNFCKRKRKIDINRYTLPESSRGYQLMLKTGWNKNEGLGPNGDGQKYPVKTTLKMNTKGLGFEKLKPRITHFKANDVSAVETVLPTFKKFGRYSIAENRMREKRKEMHLRYLLR